VPEGFELDGFDACDEEFDDDCDCCAVAGVAQTIYIATRTATADATPTEATVEAALDALRSLTNVRPPSHSPQALGNDFKGQVYIF